VFVVPHDEIGEGTMDLSLYVSTLVTHNISDSTGLMFDETWVNDASCYRDPAFTKLH
jgi:hypothetical protein